MFMALLPFARVCQARSDAATGVISVVVNGLNAQVGGFVTLSGDFGFKRFASGRIQEDETKSRSAAAAASTAPPNAMRIGRVRG